ncbi:hypothetical protein [Streptomyces naphthomycinicus]|uniref:hypothetical protein n=1 Tax=Streptomyces naphthomycinicus TaxID=2872625 RepID=UPI001CED6F06|nr:hypothetical protein [Streptomyces sp. TML10]
MTGRVGHTQYTDLTMRAPDGGVPAMLLEDDRFTEPVDDVVAKLRRYTDWFDLLAPKADVNREKAARGVTVHDFRLWSRPPDAFQAGGGRGGRAGDGG